MLLHNFSSVIRSGGKAFGVLSDHDVGVLLFEFAPAVRRKPGRSRVCFGPAGFYPEFTRRSSHPALLSFRYVANLHLPSGVSCDRSYHLVSLRCPSGVFDRESRTAIPALPIGFEQAEMKAILYPIMILAACGLALSVMAHGMAMAGLPMPGGKLVWALHAGVFVVWISTLLISLGKMRHVSRKDFWKVALAGCPAWMRGAVYLLFAYAIFNFAVFMAKTERQPNQKHSGDAPASVVSAFSGHWMLFYGAAFAILYSRIRAPRLYRERRCPQGHLVSPIDRFCSKCGHDFSNETT